MNDDVLPPQRPGKSLQASLDAQKQTPTIPPPTFRTPDEIAAQQNLSAAPDIIDTAAQPVASEPVPVKKERKLTWPPTKKQLLIGGAILLVLIGLGAAWYATHQPKKVVPVVKTTKKVVVVAPKTVPSTLSGLPVDPKVNTKPVTGVMIENSVQARPQSGLGQASVVFEAIAEGGITRFLALFQDTSPTDVGPIRSARPYYAQWALGFDAGYAHVGGSPEALANIKAWGVRDLDQFANGGSYHRISSREAPHNVYTSIDTLNQLEVGKGYATSTFTGFTRKKKEEPLKVPTAKAINLAISGPTYNVHYDYQGATNSYARAEAGVAHIDAGTNVQISPKVVIALIMPYGIEADGYHSSYNTLGSGQAYVFQDGGVTIGTWTKVDNKTQFTFADAAGKPLKLNAGQTWITALGSAGSVTYTP